MGVAPDRHLHSRYDPVREAKRFVESITVPSGAALIVVCEPGESYLAEPLRQRFPGARLLAIRYQTDLFLDSDSLWDSVWRPEALTSLDSFLFDCIPDDLLPLLGYVEWLPSGERWPQVASFVRETTRRFLELQKKILVTRTAFGPRWLKNMARNAMYARSTCILKPIDEPIFLAGAGPSLDKHLARINDNCRILAVSSSLVAFSGINTVPDICVATDGGFWALPYFKDLREETCVALPLEAAIPPAVLGRNRVSMLSYGSALEEAVLGACAITPVKARRNGTVTGTALELALDLTSNKVYGAGLDFAPAQCFSHVRNHRSEIDSRIVSNRLQPVATSLVRSELDISSLEMYAGWFEREAGRFNGRFSRLSPSGRILNGIPDSRDCFNPGADKSFSVKPKDTNGCIATGGLSQENKTEKLKKLAESLRVFFDVHSDPLLYRGDPGVSRKLIAPGLTLDFLQLAHFTGFLEILPLVERASEDASAAERIAGEARRISEDAEAFSNKIEAYANGIA